MMVYSACLIYDLQESCCYSPPRSQLDEICYALKQVGLILNATKTKVLTTDQLLQGESPPLGGACISLDSRFPVWGDLHLHGILPLNVSAAGASWETGLQLLKKHANG